MENPEKEEEKIPSIKEQFLEALARVNEEDKQEREFLERKLKEFKEEADEIIKRAEKEDRERN